MAIEINKDRLDAKIDKRKQKHKFLDASIINELIPTRKEIKVKEHALKIKRRASRLATSPAKSKRGARSQRQVSINDQRSLAKANKHHDRS